MNKCTLLLHLASPIFSQIVLDLTGYAMLMHLCSESKYRATVHKIKRAIMMFPGNIRYRAFSQEQEREEKKEEPGCEKKPNPSASCTLSDTLFFRILDPTPPAGLSLSVSRSHACLCTPSSCIPQLVTLSHHPPCLVYFFVMFLVMKCS